ncbi:hypothetical protein VQ643_12190 [Pseudomonas sp. F1_0610]|uniref:hypothetical protein n=1 Tax=Pseudomonas sp. F1_0610 TaxID=3114284 RepID=UPI0039C11FAF
MKFAMKPIIVAGLSSLLVACGGDTDVQNMSAKDLYMKASEVSAAKTAKYNFAVDATINTPQPEVGQILVKAKGALDLSALKLEANPEITFSMFNVKLPMSIDFNKQSALVDVTSLLPVVAMMAPEAAAGLETYRNKFVRFDAKKLGLPEAEASKIKTGISEIMDIALTSSLEAQASLDEALFKKEALDETAKQLGADSVVTLTMDAAQAKALDEKMNSLMQNKIEKSTSLPAEFKEGVLNGLKEAQANKDTTNSSNTKLYLKEGKALRQITNAQVTVDGNKMDIAATIDFSNYGSPKFEINPAESNIVDFNMMDAMGAAALMQ